MKGRGRLLSPHPQRLIRGRRGGHPAECLVNEPLMTQQGLDSPWGSCERTTGSHTKSTREESGRRAPDGHKPAAGASRGSTPLEGLQYFLPARHFLQVHLGQTGSRAQARFLAWEMGAPAPAPQGDRRGQWDKQVGQHSARPNARPRWGSPSRLTSAGCYALV